MLRLTENVRLQVFYRLFIIVPFQYANLMLRAGSLAVDLSIKLPIMVRKHAMVNWGIYVAFKIISVNSS
jgi:hypothetical protein